LRFFIGILLGKSNRLRLFVSDLHPQPLAGCGDRQVPVAQTTHEVKRLLRRLLERQALGVGAHALLDRLAHLRRRPEEAVGGYQTLDTLVRPLEVVGVHEKAETLLAVGEIRKDRPTQKLLPQCLPESLHLAHRLRVLGTALHVPYPLPPQLAFEIGLASPRRVLPALVGQDLLRSAISANPSRQRLHHQPRPLMVRQRIGHDEARVVVHEGCQVQPLVASQEKREDVRLPELVGRRAFEAARWVFAFRRRLAGLDETCLVQDSPYLCLAHPQCLEARQHVPNPTCPVFRVLLTHLHHGLPSHFLPSPRPTDR
jgi:hypothetical protein